MVGLVGGLVAEVIAGFKTCLVQLLEHRLQRREVQPQVALRDARPEWCGELGGFGVVWRDRVPRPSVGLRHSGEARLLAVLHVASLLSPTLGLFFTSSSRCTSVASTFFLPVNVVELKGGQA